MQLFHVYLNWFRHNSLLNCVLQPEIAKKIHKTSVSAFKVIQGRWIRWQSRTSVQLPIIYLALFLRYGNLLSKNRIFFYPLSFNAPARGDPFPKSFMNPETRVFQAAVGVDLVILTSTILTDSPVWETDRWIDKIAMAKMRWSSSCFCM